MIYSWEMAVIDDYKPLEDVEGWLKCSACGEYPRTWVFDNGNYAKCRCQYKYQGGVSAIPVYEAMHHRKMSYHEYKQLLRIAWNTYVRARAIPFQEEVML